MLFIKQVKCHNKYCLNFQKLIFKNLFQETGNVNFIDHIFQ